MSLSIVFFFFSSRRRHTRSDRDWSSDVCSSDLLIKMEALTNGYAEGIALDDRGYVSEGSGENIFLVHEGKVVTPPLASSILPGITRDSVIEICRTLEIPLVESGIQRAALYVADELFFSGTAAEVTPIRPVDRIAVGECRRGPVTER